MRELVSLKYFLDDEGAKVLDHLARDFPVELRRALKGVGFQLRRKIQANIRAGGPPGKKWQRTSRIHRYQRLELLKGGKSVSLKKIGRKREAFYAGKGQYAPDAMTRWKGGPKRSEFPMQKMVGGIRYRMESGGNGVLIGGLNPSMDRYLRSVQVGGIMEGQSKYPSKTGTQTITPAMRRLFFAAGIPLKKGRRSLSMPPRPLIRPVFEAHAQHVVNYLQLAVKNYAEGGTLTRDSMAQQAGFGSSFL